MGSSTLLELEIATDQSDLISCQSMSRDHLLPVCLLQPSPASLSPAAISCQSISCGHLLPVYLLRPSPASLSSPATISCQSISCDHQFCIRVQSSRQEPHNNLSKKVSLITSRGEKEDSKIPHRTAPKNGTDMEGREPSRRLDRDLVGDSVVSTQQMAEKLAGLI